MCGVAGFWGEIACRPNAEAKLRAMTLALSHRGPDGQGFWLGSDIGLGHTRLAIIDLERGAQPLWSSCGRYIIVFNGEIYNHSELRDRLSALGYVFHTRSDTEVIWAAIDAWGVDNGLLSLRGMFAFALYDTVERALLLARDRVGIKPLYVSRFAGAVAFASEPKALLALPEVRRRLNATGVHDYLGTGYATAPSTCWADIDALDPGSWLKVTRQGETRGRYWQWAPRERNHTSVESAAAQVDSTLHSALASHLIADVPVGALLSGGLDSSLMAAMLSADHRGLKTFSVGFADAEYDETDAARWVAQHIATDHKEVHIATGDGDPELFCTIVEQFDEPFGDSSCIPLYLICREVRKSLKVVLSGDGGDEMLGGYTRYVNARRLGTLARFNGFLPLFRPIAKIVGDRFGQYGRQTAKAWQFAQLPLPERLSALQSYFLEEERRAIYQPDFARVIQTQDTTARRLSQYLPANSADPVQQMIATEFAVRLHADYLRKVDVASSAHGLEVRVPYLDAEMLELAEALPPHLKIGRNGQTKVLSRRLARQYLPPGLSTRKKQGFSIPLDQWSGAKMRAFFKDLLFDSGAKCRALIQPRIIRGIYDAFTAVHADFRVSRFQTYQRLFLLVSLELWLRRWAPSLP